ncbi:HEWD family protein [Haladaptatus sp. DFWS20]|uniref:HEWD family protein n=1 Tax=Haladaptatus sp. DFWS20 TaxID=3403467 RepID=UPI003EB7B6A7
MAELNRPDRRRCTQCGREDEWNESSHNWTIAGSEGRPFCLHEWDINGTHNPIVESE